MKVRDVSAGRQFIFVGGIWATGLYEARGLNGDGDMVIADIVTGSEAAFDSEAEVFPLVVQLGIGRVSVCGSCGKACKTVAKEVFVLLESRRACEAGVPLCTACATAAGQV